MRKLAFVIACAQAVLAIPVLMRMIRTRNGTRIQRQEVPAAKMERVTVLVPVLDEETRLGPCLDGLIAQGEEVAEILVIDGGSADGTRALVDRYAARDRRVRWLDATPVPAMGNGKAHGLQVGYERSGLETDWLLTIDADVRVDPLLVRSSLRHAVGEDVAALSAATLQRVSGPGEALLHPAMLSTLVYRFGIPGQATAEVNRVQANGQCFLVRREVLAAVGGFAAVADSVCEDVTLARTIAAAGHPVGFYETDGLVTVAMYSGWRETWDNWTRSLPMRDRFTRWSASRGLAEVLLVQALPLWFAPYLVKACGRRHPATALNLALICTRFGVLAGTARAYERRPWTYWLSPLCDLPVALRMCSMARRRSFIWRGRPLTIGDSM